MTETVNAAQKLTDKDGKATQALLRLLKDYERRLAALEAK